jgi:hypothetical protein
MKLEDTERAYELGLKLKSADVVIDRVNSSNDSIFIAERLGTGGTARLDIDYLYKEYVKEFLEEYRRWLVAEIEKL